VTGWMTVIKRVLVHS